MSKPKLNHTNIFWITLVHLVALAAIPFFSWSNFAAAMFGLFVLAPLGINVGYHRLLTHRAFAAPAIVRRGLATLGAMIGAGAPLHWVAMHRVHHRYSDTGQDPHDATRGFWYSHVLHLFHQDPHEAGEADYIQKYAPDLAADPYLAWLNKRWLWLALAPLPTLYLAGGWGLLLWGGFVRIVLTWHVMWFVNSASHRWGYRNYETRDRTVNCWWVGLLAAGALLGAWSHVGLDAVMHFDVAPLAPWRPGNPLLDRLDVMDLHALCLAATVLGLAGLLVRRAVALRREARPNAG